MNKLVVATLFSLSILGSPAFAAEHDGQMQQHMQKMQSLMAQIKGEQDPAELEQLKSQHMSLMYEGMQMMEGSNTAAPAMDMEARVEMMEKKMQMMQMMMGQMMSVEEEEQSRPRHEHKR